ncbi:MAG TPA: hypothetical protein VHC97_16145 [Thermoanaerobaculia bacterium]|jgi:hypothetical protein|nr:hypothetical protein [Thermoanaerobaculia bacterium]
MEFLQKTAFASRALLGVLLILGTPVIAFGAGPADLLYAVEYDGSIARPAQLACTAPSMADERPGLEVRNVGEENVLLFLSNGEELLLSPGETMKLNDKKTETCVCICRCKEHGGRNRSQERDVHCIGDDPNRCPQWNDKKCFFFHSDGTREKANATYDSCEGAGVPE